MDEIGDLKASLAYMGSHLEGELEEADKLRAEIAKLRAALQEISQPLIAMQDRAKKDGYDFSGETALNIISNPEHYRSIARQALRDEQLEKDTP